MEVYRNYYRLSWCLFYFFVLCAHCGGVQLEPNGGYHVVVGIAEEVTAYVPNPVEYINNLKDILQSFSNLLWEATQNKFHIKTVQIFVPHIWKTQFDVQDAIKASINTADIVVSKSSEIPRTDNYYPCGKPGHRIQLPVEFIGDPASTERIYGPPHKGLLNLWLRYRFGVSEEHGLPGHLITPYVYQEDALDHSDWKLTSCTDNQLHGEFLPHPDSRSLAPNDICSTDGFGCMDRSCRFHPVDSNVSTSIMNFHWLNSIVKFCDEDTHKRHAPNRQNLYCNHRSVWEVIRDSVDYQKLNQSQVPVPVEPVNISVVTESNKPLLYILLDTGYPNIKVGMEMYDVWMEELRKMISAIDPEVIAKLATYPSMCALHDCASPYFNKMLDWQKLDRDAKDAFIRELDFKNGTRDFHTDFRTPLSQALQELRLLKHPNGAVVLILRTDNYWWQGWSSTIFEENFSLDLKMYGIQLYEVQVLRVGDDRQRNPRLDYLAEESGGLGINYMVEMDGSGGAGAEEARANLTRITDGVVWALREGIQPKRKYSLIYRNALRPTLGNHVMIPKRDEIDLLHVHVTTQKYAVDYIRFQLPPPFDAWPQFEERMQFGEEGKIGLPDFNSEDYGYTYSLTVNISSVKDEDYNRTWAWELYILMEDPEHYKGNILVYGSNPIGAPKSKIPARNVIHAELVTSADDGLFGCNGGEINDEPLSVYVKLTGDNGQPILLDNFDREDENNREMPRVHFAALTHEHDSSIALRDNGLGADLVANDGVYSGYFYPLRGSYRMYASFYDASESEANQKPRRRYEFGTLQSKEQNDFETTVIGTSLNTPYSMFSIGSLDIVVTMPCRNKRFISRPLNIQAAVTANDTEIMRLTFITPVFVKSDEFDSTTDQIDDFEYMMGMVRMTDDLDKLIEDPNQPPEEVFITDMSQPGKSQEVFLKRANFTFVGLELLDFRQPPTKSRPSSVVQIKGWWEPDRKPTERPPVGCDSTCITWISVGCGLAIIILLATSAILWKKTRAQRNKIRLFTRGEIREFIYGIPTPASGPQTPLNPDYQNCSDFIQSLPYNSKYEIPNNKLHIDQTELLGSGTFGNVFKGYAVNMPGTSGKVLVVAVKTIKPNVDKVYFKALLTEVKLMTHIGTSHPNIVRLIGACTKDIRKCQVFLATEFCPNGNLLSYLQNLNEAKFYDLIDEQDDFRLKMEIMEDEVSTLSLIKWSREIASGMEYLSQKRIVHGDLAARNILLDAKLIAKISDFGLSKQLVQYSKYAVEEGGGLLPWKWLAPEALQFMKFSIASDIWAFGVTMWEIFSLGQIPYPGTNWSPDFLQQLEKNGLRLLKPCFATQSIYQMMMDCWKLSPSHRPGFYKLKIAFDQMMLSVSPTDYMDLANTVEYTSIMHDVSYTNV